MSTSAVECTGLSKSYVITHQDRYLALRDRLTPRYLFDRVVRRQPTERSEEFWALKDVSFKVEPGEAVGIIGRNGAGKSTLLKLLSRITLPTRGEARIQGRVASLLEVGTGFHPELTGRENVFVNGAILGMKRRDIVSKLDAIVAFSGVEKFIDTPVKRYSSGMYVRLAFAVAAHLEPEILIVDEVLAVGDAEFQQKCLGKMQDVARHDGRTILFVSHNMTAIQSLCRRAIWLNAGGVAEEGESSRVVASYLQRHASQQTERSWPSPEVAPGGDEARVRRVRIVPGKGSAAGELTVRTPFAIEVELWALSEKANLNVSLELYTLAGDCIFAVGGAAGVFTRGTYRVSCACPGNLLNDGLYSITVLVIRDGSGLVCHLRDALTFQVIDVPREGAWMDKWPGAVRPTFLQWESQRIEEPTVTSSSAPELPVALPVT